MLQRRRDRQLSVASTARAKVTTEDVKALVASPRDIVATLAAADPANQTAVYRELGISLTYNEDGFRDGEASAPDRPDPFGLGGQRSLGWSAQARASTPSTIRGPGREK